MTAPLRDSWTESNRRRLEAEIARLSRRLSCMDQDGSGGADGSWPDQAPAYETAARETAAGQTPARQPERHSADRHPPNDPAPRREPPGGPPAALDTLAALFGLSAFERDVLVMCAGVEFDAGFDRIVAEASRNAGLQRIQPSFALALATLAEPHWSALSAQGPLRRWRLVDPGGGTSLVAAALHIDEPVLHYLAGIGFADDRLAGLVHQLVPAETGLPAPALALDAAEAWQRQDGAVPVIQLLGPAEAGRDIALAAAQSLDLDVLAVRSDVLPADIGELEMFARLVERACALRGATLLLEVETRGPDRPGSGAGVGLGSGAAPGTLAQSERFLETFSGAAFVATPSRLPLRRRSDCVFEVGTLGIDAQRALWRAALGPAASQSHAAIDRLVSHFDLGPRGIASAARQALGGPAAPAAQALSGRLWHACRMQARPGLDDLAERVEPTSGWDDLILPDDAMATLRDIAAHLGHRAQVLEEWGFARSGSRGLGTSALFFGESGTGKTLAAEVLAHELALDLYIVDLSRMVSKYIGETEKNLARLFDAAESGGAILLFDEADALFGKRSEVKDSHDRYANIEVSYLLQRMESYRGLACLTTNLKGALDPAFLRRIRFAIGFPFPDAAARERIWARVFPPEMPRHGLDLARLAQLNVTGGNIRNIALQAAFIAADRCTPVGMADVLAAARREYAKLEKPLTTKEIQGWL